MKIYKYGLWILGLSFLMLARIISSWPDGKLRYIQCDVGQGDGMIVKKGFDQILIDAGRGMKIIDCLEENLPFWDRNIELLVVTHDDFDHIGGMDEVLKRYNVGMLIDNGIKSDKEHWKEVERIIEEDKVNKMSVMDVDQLKLGDMEIKFLWPEKECLTASNDCSVVTKISYREFDMLLTGDIDNEIEKRIVNSGIESEVLKVSHHGSKAGSSEEFLEKGQFGLALIGVGENNYGHPNDEVLKRLSDKGIEMRRTDKDGEIVVVSDGMSFWVE